MCSVYMYLELCGCRKCPYSLHRSDWKFLGVGRVSKANKWMELNWNFQKGEGGGVLGKIFSVGKFG